jgi:uncharacterized protein (TIGR03086 family)
MAMATSSADAFDRGLDVFGGVAARLQAADWDRTTACEGWTALDVLGHLGTGIRFGISVLKGEEPTWPSFDRPAELVEGDPGAYWVETAEQARAALAGADLDREMDTPMGRRTVADRLAFPAIDLFVHAWDIGTPAGIDIEIPDDVIEFAHGYLDPLPAEMMRGPKGAFGPEVEPPAGATATERFVAWTGRQPR